MDVTMRISIAEIVVVEGIHDKQAVLQVANADVWVIGGDRIAHRFMEELKRASEARGILVLTDPDGPGERIRRRIEQAIPSCKHAFLAKRLATSKVGVGIEYASPMDILHALKGARLAQNQVDGRGEPQFSRQDLVAAGLVDNACAAGRRSAMGDALHIGYANAKAFLHKLNALGVSREEWEHALDIVAKGEGQKP